MNYLVIAALLSLLLVACSPDVILLNNGNGNGNGSDCPSDSFCYDVTLETAATALYSTNLYGFNTTYQQTDVIEAKG